VKAVAVSVNSSFALKKDGTVIGWGWGFGPFNSSAFPPA
jgi:hypothetical protein